MVMKECQSPPPPPPPVGSPLSMELCPGWPHIQMGGFFFLLLFFMGRVRQTCGRRLQLLLQDPLQSLVLRM